MPWLILEALEALILGTCVIIILISIHSFTIFEYSVRSMGPKIVLEGPLSLKASCLGHYYLSLREVDN